MASVQHYACQAELFPLHVIQKHATLEHIEKDRHFAALKIQRLFRGYVVRKEIAKWHRAATTIQRHIRGFLLRWHLPDMLQQYIDWSRLQYYNEMATKIQALWRGYIVRKNRVPVKDILETRQAIEEANNKIQRQMKEAFENMEKIKSRQMEKEAREWVLYILFKLHHLIRTQVQEGIYSLHGRKELSIIEELLQVLPLSEYMEELKKIYYSEIKREKSPRAYIFKTRYLQKIEDNYRNRDRSQELKKSSIPLTTIKTPTKPFVLDKRLPKKPYERLALYTEKYTETGYDLSRTVDRTKHISDKDFDLHVLKKVKFEQKPPPYYIDHWSQMCEIHNIPDT
ncbi:hypothetical protein ILUMI_20235 [Ignelater luminosus]|uniref:Spermatogenesis-associated protein 17 n=1 Tax=Ignelater luminosus TaxID=2038154 RepID=A0A8K0CLB3_IGNLU|nr:hypothetical protein ILUMI_20235 [Ignelater luminosus]